MSTPKSRRTAAFVLILAVSLLPVSGAGAAARARTHPCPVVTSPSLEGEIAAWVKSTVIDVLNKSGIRIDPNGGH